MGVAVLGIKLREEFLGATPPKTAIELFKNDNSGAAQQDANKILEITYPTFDTRKALTSLTANKPIVLLGERGQGKSHILAVLHHAVQSPEKVENWAKSWTTKIDDEKFISLSLPKGYTPITETLSNNEYFNLWDLIFKKHPNGQYYRGKFENSDHHIPPKSLLEEMFKEHPVVLILDELQTWYDGLVEEKKINGQSVKPQKWAFNFIQNLSEISKSSPEHLIFVVSVRNTGTEAYKQIHRDKPVLVDFSSKSAKSDRKKLILHRLFENRNNVPFDEISNIVSSYAEERCRLIYSDKPEVEHEKLKNDVIEAWPFSPELLNLMEDHILMGQAAQETRDLIKILADLFKARSNSNYTIITPADFYVDEEDCGVVSLLDSISSSTGKQEKLRDIAIRNLDAVKDAGVNSAYARSIISSIWLRSLTQEINYIGGTDKELHLDITKSTKMDDNAFNAELASIVELSFNIHKEEKINKKSVKEERYSFKQEENPSTKLLAYAKNDKNFEKGDDKDFLVKFIRNYIESTSSASESPSRVIVLDENWQQNPWENKDEQDKPQNWSSIVLLVMPYANSNPQEILGQWLKDHVPENRNKIRFLIPKHALDSLFDDKNLIITARAIMKAKDWMNQDSKYREFNTKYEKDLKKLIDERYTRFAVLTNWSYQNPKTCKFEIFNHNASGNQIPQKVEEFIINDIFDLSEFAKLIIEKAYKGETVKDIFDTLKEPSPKYEFDTIPYLGEVKIYEKILWVIASSKNPELSINVRGEWFNRKSANSDSTDEIWKFLKRRAYASGKELYSAQISTVQETATSSIATIELVDNTSNNFQEGSTTITQPVQPSSQPPVIVPSGVSTTAPIEPAIPMPRCVCKKTEDAKTGINLLGDLEKWTQNVESSKKLPVAKIEINNLSVQELKAILCKIPFSAKANLEVIIPGEGNE